MNQADWDAINEAIQYAPIDIRDKARLAFYSAQDGGRFSTELPDMINARTLARLMSNHGYAGEMMDEFCRVYGIELVMDEAVQFRMRGQIDTSFYPERVIRAEDGEVTISRLALSEWPDWAREAIGK